MPTSSVEASVNVQVRPLQLDVKPASGAWLPPPGGGPPGPMNSARAFQSESPPTGTGVPEGTPPVNVRRLSSPVALSAVYRLLPDRNIPATPENPVAATVVSCAPTTRLSSENGRE